MKIMKKLAAFVLALSLAFPMYSIVGYAADGNVSFTDPGTKTGETVEVTCALRAGGQGLKSFDITLKYDPEYLAFESGDEGVTKESDGVLKYSGTSNGENRIGFNMKFVALKVGSTKVEVQESTGVTAGGETITCANGNSTVKIEQGTKEVQMPATGAQDVPVTVDGVSYNLSDNFKNADIPSGFTETKLSYEGTERRFVQDEQGATILGYLVNEQGEGNFFLYNPSTSEFSAYVMVTVSPSTTIVLQKEEKGLKIPEGYQEVKLTVNDNEFPAWQNVNEEGFYLVYAMNSSTGEKGFYQYDTVEESYQRFAGGDAAAVQEKEASSNKIVKLVEENLMIVLIAVAALVLLLLIVVIVLAVKLRHRNLELDDLYEHGAGDVDELEDLEDLDDLDEVVEEPVSKEKGLFKNRFKKSKEEELEDDDDFDSFRIDDEYDDEMYEDDDFDDDYYEGDDDFDDSYDDDYDYDFDDDDETDEEYDVDFIDLD